MTPYDHVDPAPYIAIIEAAHKRGMSYAEMARVTGLTSEMLRFTKKKRFIYLSTAQKIAKLRNDEVRALRSHSLLPAKKGIQVLHSLGAQGFSHRHVAWIVENNLRVPGNNIPNLNKADRQYITKKTMDILLWLEKEIGAKQGPSAISRSKQLNRGYFPLKHYNVNGDLMLNTLTPEQKVLYRSVQS